MQESSKSQVEFYLDLCVQLVCCDPLNLTSQKHLRRDIQTLRSRCQAEGLSFLTKTLPKLGKALDQGLIESRFSTPREFKHSHDSRNIPAFMQVYFKRVFDGEGNLLDEADTNAVKHLRQVCFLLYKLEIAYDRSDESRVIEAFVQTERELELPGDVESAAILAAASYVTRDVFRGFDPKDIVPRHGPGAVATGERLDEKWEFSRLYRGIHQVYPYYEYFVVGGGRELIDRLGWYKALDRLDHGRAKVVLVPKDSRGPRLISCEPLEFQWVQQGLGRRLMAHLESFRMTEGNINFTRQEVNQQLALEGSRSQEWATLDLKDASDRVSLELVLGVFKHTELPRFLEACRTTATVLPDGRVVDLKKYAPMGSALCFPVEAYVFWSLIVAAISRERRLPPSLIGKSVFVYGDDIIVPTDWASTSMQVLERFALKVNRQKSCVTGNFRESCGMDAFKGERVTPLRVKKLWTNKPSDGSALSAYVAFANQIAAAGYKQVSDFVWDRLEKVHGKLPLGLSTSSFPCKVVQTLDECIEYNSRHFPIRWSRQLQRIEFRVKALKSRHSVTTLDSWPRALRNLTSERLERPTDVVHPRSTKIIARWSQI